MATQSITKMDAAGKHIVVSGILTLILGLVAAYAIPGVGSVSSLNLMTALSIVAGAMIGAVATAHDKIKHPLIAAIISAGITTIVTSWLYQAFAQQFTAVVGIVFVGSFLATFLSKTWLRKKMGN